MTAQVTFIHERFRECDAVVLRVDAKPQPQHLSAYIEKIYTTGKGIIPNYLEQSIEFISSPGHWGQENLIVGDRAVAFLCLARSGILYEYHWRGHFWIEHIDGTAFATVQFKNLQNSSDLPGFLTDTARKCAKHPGSTAFEFAALERFLKDVAREVRSSSELMFD